MNVLGLRVVLLLIGLLLLAGCGDRTPIRIGFVAGISGRVADLGIGGRNGAILAVEQVNQAGGIDGRPVELLIRDDQQKADVAKQVVQDLLAQSVVAIVGPMTSSMCAATLELANTAQRVMMSPTCTSTQFSGIDDHFFRVISATTDYAKKSVDYQVRVLGHKTFSVVYDQGNRAYAESWLKDFQQHLEKSGGRIGLSLTFTSSPDVAFADLARQLTRSPADAILIIANSVDAAQLARQLDSQGNKAPLIASEWSATERLIELGGKAVEGMRVAQFVDRESRLAEYLAFQAAYLKRFNQEPGFAGVAGYDATRVVLEALAGKPPARSLKQQLLEKRAFKGVSGPVEFTETGDAQRSTYLTVIRDGRFLTLK